MISNEAERTCVMMTARRFRGNEFEKELKKMVTGETNQVLEGSCPDTRPPSISTRSSFYACPCVMTTRLIWPCPSPRWSRLVYTLLVYRSERFLFLYRSFIENAGGSLSRHCLLRRPLLAPSASFFRLLASIQGVARGPLTRMVTEVVAHYWS